MEDPHNIIGPAKAILYLDQFIISNITVLLDPDSPRYDRVVQDPYWLKLYTKLDRLLRLQLIVCPDSHFHRTESLISQEPSFESLQDVYSYLSNDCTFKDATSTLNWQVQHYFRDYVNDHPEREPPIPATEFIIGDPNEWQDRIRVTVPYPSDADEVALLRNERGEQHRGLEEVFKKWQLDKTPFTRSAEEEARALGGAIFASFRADLRKQMTYGLRMAAPNSLLDLLPSPLAQLVYNMFRILAEHSITDPLQQLQKVGEYLESPHFFHVPFVRLSAMLYASIARKAQAGRRALPNEGTITDVTAIAAILPYCDAMFIDREMAGYLREAPLESEVEKFGTRIFASNIRSDFLAYLEEIETKAGPAHLRLVKAVYGEDWLEPFMDVVTQGRGSRQRDTGRGLR